MHGIDGLRPKRSAYSAKFKLQVLAHQDRGQLSSRQVAALYDISNPCQIVDWRCNLDQAVCRPQLAPILRGHGPEWGARCSRDGSCLRNSRVARSGRFSPLSGGTTGGRLSSDASSTLAACL